MLGFLALEVCPRPERSEIADRAAALPCSKLAA